MFPTSPSSLARAAQEGRRAGREAQGRRGARVSVEDDEDLVVLTVQELDELLEAAVQRERARAVRIVIEEGGDIVGELCGIICAKIDESA